MKASFCDGTILTPKPYFNCHLIFMETMPLELLYANLLYELFNLAFKQVGK